MRNKKEARGRTLDVQSPPLKILQKKMQRPVKYQLHIQTYLYEILISYIHTINLILQVKSADWLNLKDILVKKINYD